jgi:hypothetical protein
MILRAHRRSRRPSPGLSKATYGLAGNSGICCDNVAMTDTSRDTPDLGIALCRNIPDLGSGLCISTPDLGSDLCLICRTARRCCAFLGAGRIARRAPSNCSGARRLPTVGAWQHTTAIPGHSGVEFGAVNRALAAAGGQ